MSGINIVTYSLPILAITSLNLGVHDALLLGVFAQLWYALASLATWWTIDRVGRRPLLVVNAVAMSFLLFVLSMSVLVGATTVVHPRPPAAAIAGVIATVCVFLFEAAFTWGWMASVWIYPPEILPLGIRARGTAVASAAGFFGNLVVVAVTPIGIARLGWVFYLLWALFDLVNAAVVWMVYPETGGLELEIVDKIFTVEVPFAQEEEVHDPGHVGFCTGYVRKTQALQWDRVKLAALLKANRARVLPEQRPLLDSFLDE